MSRRTLLPSVDYLREFFVYDAETGVLSWRKRPHGRSLRQAGDAAGTLLNTGYLQVNLKGVFMLVHRVAWKMHTGCEPPLEIDHANRNKADNRWTNMREAEPWQNRVNRRAKNDHPGVHYIAARRKFGAQMRVAKRHLWLGSFSTAEEACAARRAAAALYHAEFSQPRRCACL